MASESGKSGKVSRCTLVERCNTVKQSSYFEQSSYLQFCKSNSIKFGHCNAHALSGAGRTCKVSAFLATIATEVASRCVALPDCINENDTSMLCRRPVDSVS